LLYIFSGQDDFSINRALSVIKKSLGDPEMLGSNTNILDGSQVKIDEFRAVCESAPFLSLKRMVIVHGLLARFSIRVPAVRSRTSKKTEQHPVDYEAFGNCISNLPDSTVLVLIESEIKDTNPLFKMISGKAIRKSFPFLKPPELRDWVTTRVATEGGTISPSAVNLIIRLVGSNLWVMSAELNKLVSYTSGQRIEEKDIKALVSYTEQINIFTLVDAIMEFNTRAAETYLQQLLQEGAAPTYVLVMLCRQMRLIVRAGDLRKQGLREPEIRQRMGVASEYVVRKALEQASRYSISRINQVYQQLLDTDIAIKTGKYSGELALNILVVELCQQTQPALA
jgi:DNA polymerase-3 subunit delta